MRTRIIAIGMLLMIAAALSAAMQNGNDLYQQGLARETAGDIKGAIQIFERIVRDYSSNRTLTARALVQLGRWSDLLGQDQARKHYERVIREFSDQKESFAEARTRLDMLGKVAVSGANPARRLVVDWGEWNNRTGGTNGATGRPTRDGRHLLRYNEKDRAFELVEISSGEVRRLTSDGPDPASGAFANIAGATYGEFSADGRKLAVVLGINPKPLPNGQFQFERVELRVFDVGGRGPGRVISTASEEGARGGPFAWSPGNDRIWMWTIRGDRSAQIASLDLNGKMQVLKTLTWRDHTQPPSLSPDGKFIAYHDATDRQSRPDLYIIATDGSREQRIEHPADDSKPMFLPDGSGIVFESNRRGVRDLWFQGVTDGRPVGEPRLVWRQLGAFGQVERFADPGSLVFYFAYNDYGTYTVPIDLNATAPSIGAATRLAPMVNESNSGAAFSPDGRYLAHFRTFGSRLVIRELTTGLEREIPFGTQLGAGYSDANWCSTNDVLIASGYIDGVGDVAYRVNLKDASLQRLPIAPRRSSTLCIGDGEEIIYVPSSARDSIVRRSVTSGRETTLFKGDMIEAISLSTDGKRLAFVIGDANRNLVRVVTMPATGGDVSADLMTSGFVQQIQGRKIAGITDAVWMPSGDRLLVVRIDEGVQPNVAQPPTTLWEVPLTAAAPRKLGILPVPKVTGIFYGADAFTVHPDGKRLAFQSHEGFVQQTWAIDNLAQFIKAGGGY